jgi:hypothetical protein
MQSAPQFLSSRELEAGLAEVLSSPREIGRLEVIVVRPRSNERCCLTSAHLTPEQGIEGDRWIAEQSAPEIGEPDWRSQVSLMNSRILRQIAGHEDAVALAGDNLIVDFDLSEEFLPAGSKVAIGRDVILEITATPHTGCKKFEARYGAEARAFINPRRRDRSGRHGMQAPSVAGLVIVF